MHSYPGGSKKGERHATTKLSEMEDKIMKVAEICGLTHMWQRPVQGAVNHHSSIDGWCNANVVGTGHKRIYEYGQGMTTYQLHRRSVYVKQRLYMKLEKA